MNFCLFLGFLVEGGQKESSGCNRHRKDLGLRKSVVLFLSVRAEVRAVISDAAC